MRRVGCQSGLLVVLGFVAGCFTISPEQKARDVASAYCTCFVTPSEVEECIGELVPMLPPITDACLDCVYANSQTCSTLDDECTDLCDDNSTPLLGGM